MWWLSPRAGPGFGGKPIPDVTPDVVARRIMPLEGAEMFTRTDGQWYRLGERLPAFGVPMGALAAGDFLLRSADRRSSHDYGPAACGQTRRKVDATRGSLRLAAESPGHCNAHFD